MISTGDAHTFEWKEAIVREELVFGATGLPVVQKGRQGSYALQG